jgi:protocatechuate 3,4-dioxygenase alpha subunit
MAQSLDRLKESPSQTAGPYVHIGLTPNFSGIAGVYHHDLGGAMVNAKTKGERISVKMRVLDGTGTPLRDALIEIWQADAAGLYTSPVETRGEADSNFFGWNRRATDMETGECVFETIKPGRVPFPDGRLMAPHITVWIVARGINLGLHTRMYFGDEEKGQRGRPHPGPHRASRPCPDTDRAAARRHLHFRHPSPGGEGNDLLR